MKQINFQTVVMSLKLGVIAFLVFVASTFLSSFTSVSKAPPATIAVPSAEDEMSDWIAKVDASRDRVYKSHEESFRTVQVIVLK